MAYNSKDGYLVYFTRLMFDYYFLKVCGVRDCLDKFSGIPLLYIMNTLRVWSTIFVTDSFSHFLV